MTKKEKDKLLIQRCLDERWYPVMNGIQAWRYTQCALCDEYNRCYGCPVALTEKDNWCVNTPYHKFHRSLTVNDKCKPTKLPQAQPMIDFLEKLRDSL